jgi:hypothetical protein
MGMRFLTAVVLTLLLVSIDAHLDKHRLGAGGVLGDEQPVGQKSLEPAPIPAEQFSKVLTLIKPQPGELRFHEIPWHIDVWEARKQAAKEGKPILVWSGAGGAPLGVC